MKKPKDKKNGRLIKSDRDAKLENKQLAPFLQFLEKMSPSHCTQTAPHLAGPPKLGADIETMCINDSESMFHKILNYFIVCIPKVLSLHIRGRHCYIYKSGLSEKL